MLVQLGRLDGLVSELLAMTQRADPCPAPIDLANFLRNCLARHSTVASDRPITLRTIGATGTAMLDPAIVGRVLDNLRTNAIRCAPRD